MAYENFDTLKTVDASALQVAIRWIRYEKEQAVAQDNASAAADWRDEEKAFLLAAGAHSGLRPSTGSSSISQVERS